MSFIMPRWHAQSWCGSRLPFVLGHPFFRGCFCPRRANPRPVCAKNAAFSVVFCPVQSVCAVKISFVFTWRLIENETISLWKTQRVLIEWASYGLDSVVNCGIEGFTSDLLWVIPTKHSEMVTISLQIVVRKDI